MLLYMCVSLCVCLIRTIEHAQSIVLIYMDALTIVWPWALPQLR